MASLLRSPMYPPLLHTHMAASLLRTPQGYWDTAGSPSPGCVTPDESMEWEHLRQLQRALSTGTGEAASASDTLRPSGRRLLNNREEQ